MKRTTTLVASAAVGVMMLAGCAKKSETTYTDSANTTTTTGTTSAPSDTSNASGTNATPPMQQNLSDANIIAMMIEADSGEVAQAKLVQSKTKNASVKGFAAEMIRDHSKGKSDMEALAKKLNVTPQPPANDPHPGELTQWMSTLGSTSDPKTLDSVYMNHMVEDHTKDIQDVTELQTKAQSADLKNALDKTLPVLKKHLTDAQAVVKKLESGASTAKK